MNPIHFYRTILSAAGEQASVLKRCLRDSVIAASLQGASFALLVPICLALGAGNNRAAVLWLLALTALLILSSIFRWRAQDYDYHGNCARAGDTMRRHLGEHLRRIPLQILYRQRSGELNALLAGTIDETYNHTLIVSNMLIAAVFTPLATALITLIWDWRLGLILLISFPFIVPIQHGTQPLMVACIRFAEPLGQILSMSSIYSMVQQGYARLQELLAVAPLARVGEAAATSAP